MGIQEVQFFIVCMLNVLIAMTFVNAMQFQRALRINPPFWLRLAVLWFVAVMVLLVLFSLSVRILGRGSVVLLALFVWAWWSSPKDEDDD